MALSQKEADIQMLLAAGCHLGTKNCSFQVRLVFGSSTWWGRQLPCFGLVWQMRKLQRHNLQQ